MSSLRRLARRAVLYVPGVHWFKQRFIDPHRSFHEHVVRTRPSERGVAPTVSTEDLQRAYQHSEAAGEADTFVLYRIIGNDLTPRHRKGQSRNNLEFILKHEPELEACQKRFVVNRIVDPDEERRILELLDDAGLPYVHIPFRWDEYAEAGWDVEGIPSEYMPYRKRFAKLDPSIQGRIMMRLYRHKNNYVMNNNGARNTALRDGRDKAKWVLPWDGNCFLTRESWQEIRQAVTSQPEIPYWLVPMARITDNDALLDPGFRPRADEEPQILFRKDAQLEFNEEYFYGRRPKVELFWRLGVPAKWDNWPVEFWDLPCADYAREAGAFGWTGWVARLFSGQARLEQGGSVPALAERGLARVEAVVALIDKLDEQAREKTNPESPVFVSRVVGNENPNDESGPRFQLRSAANDALARGPYSVVDKTTLPPSGNRHDYWHPAPYYWPHPLRIPGMPYVKRDGRRVPGTRLYESLSERYDRTRLQRLFDDTFVLTLAWKEFGEKRHAEHAAMLVRHWFLNPETAMTPNLEYAQVRKGHNGNKGNSSGIIEMKDLYFFLDAVRLLRISQVLSTSELQAFTHWLEQYAHWLRTSPQGQEERASTNNHGTYFDLQLASIATFLGDRRMLRDTLRDSRMRILQQFEPNGLQPEEMKRATSAHYCCFNLQGWIQLAQLAEHEGEDLWHFTDGEGRGIRQAMEWLLPYLGADWPYRQIDEFDRERFFPIYYAYRARFGAPPRVKATTVPSMDAIKPLFHPHDGIQPFWQLSSAMKGTAKS